MLLGARIASMAGGGSGPTPPTPSYWGLHFVAEEAGAQIGMATVGSPDPVTLEYSTDNGSTWATFTPGTTTVTLAAVGDTACFRAGAGGNTKISKAQNDYRKFTTTKKCACHGNVMSLLNGTDDATATAATMGERCFRQIFSGCNITTAPSLPAMALANYCYDNLFRDCTLLTSAPELPATTVKNYCYRSMFYGCSSLATAPELNATALAMDCYAYMFNRCTSLEIAPGLPAQHAAADCYYNMFYGASSLKSIMINFNNWQEGIDVSSVFGQWVYGVAETGTFRCKSTLGTNANITRGVSRCPSGWTVVNI